MYLRNLYLYFFSVILGLNHEYTDYNQYIPALGEDHEFLDILPSGQRMLDEPEGQDSSEDVRAWYHIKVQGK